MYKTRATKKSEVSEKWYLVDATGHRLGRVATAVAELLLAKNEPTSRDYLTPQNKVIIVNADKLDITAKRAVSKIYTHYTGFPGGMKTNTLAEVMEKTPAKPLEHAIRGMLPRNRRGLAILSSNLYVYAGAEHKHEAQKPVTIDLNKFKL